MFFLIFYLPEFSFGQINYEEIKKQTSNENSDMYYPSLVERLDSSDSTLTLEDFQAIYYGAIYHTNFDLKKIQDAEKLIRLANYAGEFLEAYNLANNLLKEYPVSIQAYFEKSYACFNLKRFEEEIYNNKRYKVLIRTILSSGDGKSFETAYHANLPNDEYEVMKFLKLTYKEEAELETNGETYDVFTLKPNKSKLKQLYFNISAQGREN